MKDPDIRGDAYAVIQIAVPKTVAAKEWAALFELERIREKNAG